MEPKIFILKCTVCGTKTGEYEMPHWWQGDVADVTLADIGISDTRCDEHPPEKVDQAPFTLEMEGQ